MGEETINDLDKECRILILNRRKFFENDGTAYEIIHCERELRAKTKEYNGSIIEWENNGGRKGKYKFR